MNDSTPPLFTSKRPFSDREIVEKCCHNLTQTYFHIAQSAPGYQSFEQNGILGCTSESDHPVCNFGFVARPNFESVLTLTQLSQLKVGFTTYLLPTDQEDSALELLSRHGFQKTTELNLMFFRGNSEVENSTSRPEVESAADFSSRLELMHFLVGQFFRQSSSDFQHYISSLTAQSNWSLQGVKVQNQWLAGYMLTQSSGIFGFYNLAVHVKLRGQGLGVSLVHHAIEQAGDTPLVLQCSDQLVAWYERIGFRKYGKVRVLVYSA